MRQWSKHHISDVLITINCKKSNVKPRLLGLEEKEFSHQVKVWHSPVECPPMSWHKQGSTLFILLGRLYSYRDKSGETKGLLKKIAIDYVNDSMKRVSLNGSFILAVITNPNPESLSKVSFFTDRMGSVHAYLGKKGKSLALGTCFKQVCKSIEAEKVDWAAVRKFAGTGFFGNDETWFEEIKIIKPATQLDLEVNKGKAPYELSLTQKRYWRWETSYGGASFEDTIEAYDKVLHQCMASRISQGLEPMGLGVSGGLDSRNLLGLLAKVPGLFAYSYGYEKSSVELEIASDLCQNSQVNLHRFEIGDYLLETIEEHLNFSEGFADVTQARQVSVLNELSHSMKSVFMGHWGDVFHDTSGLYGQTGLRDEQLVSHELKKFIKKGDPNLEGLFADRLPKGYNYQIDLHTGMLQELKFCKVESNDFTLKALKTWLWSFRNTMTGIRVFQMGAEPLMPFYDNRLVDFFQSVPDEMVHDRRLQIAWIKKFHPELARVKWQETGFPLGISRSSAKILRLPSRIQAKIKRSLGIQKLYERNWERQFKGKYPELLEFLLEKNRGSVAIGFPDKEIKQLVENVRLHPTAENGYALSMLFSLITTLHWLK